MLKELSEKETADLIIDLFEQDPNTTRQFVGSMEFHSGRHQQHGRITVVREIGQGLGTAFPTPRPILTLASTKAHSLTS